MTERSQRILDDLKARQRAGERMACPRCGMDVMKTPVHTNALSRAADVYICDACGSTEAMLAYMHQSYCPSNHRRFGQVCARHGRCSA